MTKLKLILIFWLCASALVVGGCNSTGGTETGNPSDSVALAMSDGIDVLSGSLGSDAQTLSALTLEGSGSHSQNPVGDLSALTSCDDSGLSTDIACQEENHQASIIRHFGTGCDASDGVTVTGTSYAAWFDLGEAACQNSAQRPNLFSAVQGTGTRQILSTGPVSSRTCTLPTSSFVILTSASGNTRIRSCRTSDYSGYASSSGTQSFTESLSINENRVRFTRNQDVLFNHTISTSSPLVFAVSKTQSATYPTRTLASGTLRVVHNVAGYTVTHTFTDLRYNYATCRCHPVSGRVDVAVTNTTTGASVGTGVITFTQTTTGQCDTTTATYNDESVTLSLGTCSGF